MGSSNFNMAESINHVTAYSGDAAAVGACQYVNSDNIRRMWAIVEFIYGADVDMTIEVYEADDVSGTNAQAITKDMPIWSNKDMSLTNDWDKSVPGTPQPIEAASYTIDTGAGKNQKVMIQIDPVILSDGKPAIAVFLGASDVANIVHVAYFIEPRIFGRSHLA